MGYLADEATVALRDADGNLQQAVEILLDQKTQVKQHVCSI